MAADDASAGQHPSQEVGRPRVERAADAAALLADLQRQVAEGIRARPIAEGHDPDTAAQTFLADELLAERATEAQREEELVQHYARMHRGGRDDPEDAGGLVTERALAAAASGYSRKNDGCEESRADHHAPGAVPTDDAGALPIGSSPSD